MARWTVVPAAALALALGLASPASATGPVVFDPDEAGPGTSVIVSVEEFVDPGDGDLPRDCTVSLAGKDVTDDCEVDADGLLVGTFTVPADAAPGKVEVEAKAGDVSVKADLTVVEATAPEDEGEAQPSRPVIVTPAGRSDENGRTPVLVLVLAGVATLGIAVFRAWRRKNPPAPLTPGRSAADPAGTGGAGGAAPSERSVLAPPQRIEAYNNGPSGGGGGGGGGGGDLRLRSRPDNSAEVVLLDLEEPDAAAVTDGPIPVTVRAFLFGAEPVAALADSFLESGAISAIEAGVTAKLGGASLQGFRRQLAGRAAEWLTLDPAKILAAGLRKHAQLVEVAAHTADSGASALVPLGEHRISLTRRPEVDVDADGTVVGTVAMELVVTIDIADLQGIVRDGVLVEIEGGRCEMSARFSVLPDAVLAQQAVAFDPNLAVPLDKGIRLAKAPEKPQEAGG
jgi:hypothetical protein